VFRYGRRCEPNRSGRVRSEAKRNGLRVRVVAADLSRFEIDETYDTVVCLGVLMFFAPQRAMGLLRAVQAAVRPGGVAALKVLVEGSTFDEYFDPELHHLFPRGVIERSFDGWGILESKSHDLSAPGGMRKLFKTVVARRP
jgi:tellurite methyltransferase